MSTPPLPNQDELGPDRFDTPIEGVSEELLAEFQRGDELFSSPFRDADGLGPLYIRIECGSCHRDALRGPGLVEKMVVVESDGLTTSADQSKLPFGHTVRPLVTAGAVTPIEPPDHDASIKTSIRVGPPLLGRGYMEAVLDSELERVEREQAARDDGIHGRINHVLFSSEPNSDTRFHHHQKGDRLFGRFGVKARIGSIDDFVADALQGDIGITTPMRPIELPNPDALSDDLKPGLDADLERINAIAAYVRLQAIPRRVGLTDRGRELFDRAKCSVCHVPALRTRPDYPIPELADIDAPIYSDLLLHEWGSEAADSVIDGEAGESAWRTCPLIGLRFQRTFLHDGRAQSVEEAIWMHAGDGEPGASIAIFSTFSSDEQQALFAFVNAL